MGYKQEIDALGRWVFGVAGLRSHRLSAAPPQVARPVILWEAPSRAKGQNFGRYNFTKNTSQFGKLYVNNLDDLADLVDQLEKHLGDHDERLPIYESEAEDAPQVGWLRRVEIDLSTSQSVDVPITIKYEVTYSRPLPAEVPAATSITSKFK